ncbi:hypothetical protein Clacol_000857 [Clathrus columnatus]|uniref:DUF6533 domain-containing protein n=1 Tax=Clathrus columnatus TaxID=1419009 RepID=A0AAV4ZXA4_9AGAM|nr:hypothetical protein Clacol_000857 [Clathrus columnatus]
MDMITVAECIFLLKSNYLDVVYDYLLTMNQEVTLIWPTAWNLAKVLFLINRYVPFIGGLLLIYINIAALDLSFDAYSTLHETAGALIFIGLLFAEAIVLFRTWALFGCNPRVGLALLAFAIGLISTGIFFLISAIRPSSGTIEDCDSGRYMDFNNDKHVYEGLTGRFILFQHILHSIFATRIFLSLRVAARKHNSEGSPSEAGNANNDNSISNPTGGFLSTIVVGVGTWVHEDDTYFNSLKTSTLPR